MAGRTLIYVGAEADGLYRKEAGDSRWEKLAKGMPPSPQVRAIVVHPNDASTVFVGNAAGAFTARRTGGGQLRADEYDGGGGLCGRLSFIRMTPTLCSWEPRDPRCSRAPTAGENWEYLSTIANPDSVQMAFATPHSGHRD